MTSSGLVILHDHFEVHRLFFEDRRPLLVVGKEKGGTGGEETAGRLERAGRSGADAAPEAWRVGGVFSPFAVRLRERRQSRAEEAEKREVGKKGGSASCWHAVL